MSPAQLDHIIILVPYATLSSIPDSISSAFHVSAGGKHADNKTENRLIILRDGVYLELIAFVNDDPTLKKGHWWGALPNGVIDFALTSKSADDVATARQRLESLTNGDGLGVTYEEPRRGGRKRPDGKDVQWFVTFPKGVDDQHGVRRGSVPFWCHDVTDRELRVPAHDDAAATKHPSGAKGVKSVVLGVPKGKMMEFRQTYAAILGVEGKDAHADCVEFSSGIPFGEDSETAIILEEFEETEARVLKLVIRTTAKGSGQELINDTLGGGNKIHIEFEE